MGNNLGVWKKGTHYLCFQKFQLSLWIMVELFKAVYPKVTIKDFNGYLLSTYYMQACKWIFVFTQGKQNITDGKGYLKFGVISSGKTFN